MRGPHGALTRTLHALDPETAHGLAIRALTLRLGPKSRAPAYPSLAVHLAGLSLPNCIGLAAREG